MHRVREVHSRLALSHHGDPGLSGLAQVTGGYDLLPKEKVVLDLKYIEHRSIAMDLKIILKTLGVVSTGEGAR